MKKSSSGFLLFLALACSGLATQVHGQNSQELLDVGSRAYSYLDALFLEQGLAPPNKARPWSIEELRQEFGRLQALNLSAAGVQAYGYLKSLVDLPKAEPVFKASAGAILVPEVFARMRLAGSAGAEVAGQYPWVHGYEERKALLEFPLEFWLGDGFYAVSVFAAKEEHATVREEDNYSNLLVDDPNVRLDLYFPFKAYAAVGGPGWSFRFGRDSLSWGNGHTGNMVLSDWSDFYDHLGLSLFGERFKFSSVYAVFDPFDPKPGHERYAYSAFMGHRLDILLHDRLRLGLTEAMSFGGDYQPELVRDVNTFMIFHNWMIPERTNSLMALELDYTPWRWFSLYGQVAMDEFATKYEEDRTGGGGPPVMGYLAGALAYYPLGKAYLKVGLEWAMTSPWLYNRRAAPYFYNVRRYWSLTNDDWEYVVKPVGYRYGPDAMVWNTHASWDLPGGPAVSVELVHVIKGNKTIDTEWAPEAGDPTPSGDTPEKALILKLDGRYPLSARLEAGAGLVLNSRWNIGNLKGSDTVDLECSLFLKAAF